MARESYVFCERTQEVIPRDEYYARQPLPKRSGLPSPAFIGDTTEVVSMVDGKTYTSKAALRQSYRAQGYVEVGNEEQRTPPKPKPDRRKVRESVEKALSRAGLPTT